MNNIFMTNFCSFPFWVKYYIQILFQTDHDTTADDTQNESTISLDTTIDSEREPYFEPVVSLPEVEIKTNEEDEIELLKM